jgi:aspartate/methionine/tyrosine aminotransferase
MVLNAVIRDSRDAILVPIPQYPLYSAAIQNYGDRYCCTVLVTMVGS